VWQKFFRKNNGTINSIPEIIKSLLVPLQRYRLKSLSAAVIALHIATVGMAPNEFVLAIQVHAGNEGSVRHVNMFHNF